MRDTGSTRVLEEFPMYAISRTGEVYSALSMKFLKPWTQNNDIPYLRIKLYNREGKRVAVFVHTLVARAWLGPKPEGMQVDHFDRNSLNNSIENLRYVDDITNMANRDPKKRLKQKVKRADILVRRNAGESLTQISKVLGVSVRTISALLKKD